MNSRLSVTEDPKQKTRHTDGHGGFFLIGKEMARTDSRIIDHTERLTRRQAGRAAVQALGGFRTGPA